MVQKEDWLEWKSNTVTEELYKDVRETVEALASKILTRVESNPSEDQYLKGFLKGLLEAIEWTPTFTEVEDGTS
jgi:hypothetical protein